MYVEIRGHHLPLRHLPYHRRIVFRSVILAHKIGSLDMTKGAIYNQDDDQDDEIMSQNGRPQMKY
ncbi:hypothetical protein BLOT_013241, partial [Blomia tropicalis]